MSGFKGKVGGGNLVPDPFGGAPQASAPLAPGKRTLVDQLPLIPPAPNAGGASSHGAPVQRHEAAGDAPQGEAVPQAAASGGAGAGGPPAPRLSFRDVFGRRPAAAPEAAESAPPAPSEGGAKSPVDQRAATTEPSAAAPSELPYRADMERSFGRPLGHVQAYMGANAELAPHGAQALAAGHVVAFADAQPSPAIVAHEVTHTVQNDQAGTAAAMASGVVAPRDSPAEAEADANARRVAQHGAGVRLPPVTAAPAAHVHLAPAGAAHAAEAGVAHAAEAGAASVPTDAPPTAQVPHARWPVFAATGKPYQIVSAKDPVQLWTVSAWLRSDAGFVAHGSHAKSPACAAEILDALGWVPKDRIAHAANDLVFDISQPIRGQQLSARAFSFVGLPTGRPVVSREGGDVVAVATPLDNPDVPDGTRVELDDAQRLAVLRALASFTGLAPAPDAVDVLRTHPQFRALVARSGVLLWPIDQRTGNVLFGTDDTASTELPYTRWLHGKLPGKQPAARAPDKPKLQLHNFYGQPIPGTLRADRELVESAHPMWLEINVRWPKRTPSAADYDVVPMVTPGHGGGEVGLLRCDWQIEPVGGTAPPVRAHTEVAELHHAFVLPPGQRAGSYRVTVRAELDAYFEPVELETMVEVKSTAAAMQQLGDEAFADLGAHHVTRAPESFDASGSGDDNHGWRTQGDLAAGFAPSRADAPDPGAAGRAAKAKHLEATRLYLQANGASADTLAAVDRSLAASQRTETALADDRARGWQPFELRGTYLSREDGVPSGPLALYGTVHAEGPRLEAGVAVLGSVVVQIRDLSRRFDNEDMTFTGRGATFEAALKAAFLDNAKAYPTGVMEIQAEEIEAKLVGGKLTVGTSHGKTIGFGLGTDSRWKRVRATVWDPAVNLAANLGAMALMAFVPGSAVVVAPLLIAYNSAQTIDRAQAEATRGTLTLGSASLSVGEIALNVLPLLGRAQAFTKGWFLLEGANWGGQAVLMTASAIQAGRALQAGDIATLAAMYEELQKLEASGAGPAAIEPKRQQILARAKQVSHRIEQQFGEQISTNAMFAVAGSVIHRAAAMTEAGQAALLDAYDHTRGAAAPDDASTVPAVRTTRIGPHDRVDHEATSSGEQIEAVPLTRAQRSELVRTKDLNPRRDGTRLAAKASDDTLALGKKLASESEGQAILSRLAAGDASALTDIGVKDLPDGYNPALREFALLETRDGYIIVTGGRRSVEIPHGTRLLGHTHPESLDIDGHERMLDLRHEAGPHEAEVTFAEIARDQRTAGANESGLIPSPADVDAVGEGGYQVLHTRYVHKGGGKIANPASGTSGPRVSVVISDVRAIVSNPTQQTTIYEATFTVRAGGETLWIGKVYVQRVEFGEGRFDQLWFDPPNSVKRHLEAKTP